MNMNCFARFFLGTPRRFLASAIFAVIGMVIVHFQPGLVYRSADRLACECMPVIKAVLTCVIVLAGFRMIVAGGRGRVGGGRH
ncbi:MAG: hypothetical protein Q7S57_02755 [bacterium]|nr:hypothetical protein [bacterium]